MTIEEYFSSGPEFERPVFETVRTHLLTLGEPFFEPVSVGIFVKRDGVGVVQLRTMTRWVAMLLWLPRLVRDERISRKPIRTGSRFVHTVNARGADDVDDVVRSWLTEAWESAVCPV